MLLKANIFESKGLSQLEVSRQLGICEQTLIRWHEEKIILANYSQGLTNSYHFDINGPTSARREREVLCNARKVKSSELYL